jgi:pimeloyl-ACP methyl ester carboxylesterase
VVIKKWSVWRLVLMAVFCIALISGIPWIGPRLVSWATFFPEPGVQLKPEAFPAPIETVYLETEDKVRISGFFLPRENSRRVILFLHGNAGNASHRLPDAVALWSLNANVLLLDYRGYGLSEGTPSESGVYRDAEAALSYLMEDLGFSIEEIVIFGRSIGSAVAVHIAQEKSLNGLILISPLTSGRDVARSQGLHWALPIIGDPFNSLAKIRNVSAPVMVIHGERDEILPVEMGEALHHEARDRRGFFVIPKAGHNNLIERAPDSFFGHIRNFFADLESRME